MTADEAVAAGRKYFDRIRTRTSASASSCHDSAELPVPVAGSSCKSRDLRNVTVVEMALTA
jgi:hypothetical protein